MARPGVSYLDVAQAATKLLEQDVHPSIEEVRKVLGTGSNSTINRHIRAWREKQGNQIELEQGLPESLLIAVKGIYEAIKEESASKVDAIKKATDNAIFDLNGQLNDVNTAKSQLIQSEKALEEAIEICQAEKSALQRSLDEVRKNLDKQSNENSLLKSRLHDRISEIDRLSEQLGHAQKNLDHYRESIRQEREHDRRYFEEKVAALEKHRQGQDERLLQETQKSAVLTEQVNSLENNKKDLDQKLEIIVPQCHQYEIEIHQHKSDYRNLNEAHNEILGENESLAEKIKVDENTINQLKLDNEKTKAHVCVLEMTLEKADDTVKNFTDKNLFLMQEKTGLEAQLKQVLVTK